MITATISAFVDSLVAQWLIDSLWATTLLLALVMMLRRPVAHFFGSKIAYLLWAIPLARLLLPPVNRTVEIAAPARPDAALAFLPEGAIGQAGPAVIQHAPAMASSTDWVAIALTLWLCGAGVFFVSQLAAYLQNRRELLADATPLATRDGIRIVEIAGISGPFAFGLFKRYIALPLGFERGFDPVERDLALAHEIAHHRGGDIWANFAGLVMLSLHWFNPIAWLAWRAFRFDQEAACDARVLALRSDNERAAYARAIAKAATGRTLVFASRFTPRTRLAERLRMIGHRPGGKARSWLGSALVLGGLGLGLTATATVTYAYQIVEDPAPTSEPHAIEETELPPSAIAPDAPQAPQAPASFATVSAPPSPPAPPSPADGVRISGSTDTAVTVQNKRSGETVLAINTNGVSQRMRISDCKGRGDAFAFLTQEEKRRGGYHKTNVLTCGDVRIDEKQLKQIVSRALASAEPAIAGARAAIVRDRNLSDRERKQALAELDADMAEMQRDLAEAERDRKEALRDAEQARQEALIDAAQARAEAQRDAAQARAEAQRDAQAAREQARADARAAREEARAARANAKAMSGRDND